MKRFSMMSTVSTACIACGLLLHALVGSALAAAEGGSPGACTGAEACIEEASEDDLVALLQARQPAAATALPLSSSDLDEPAPAVLNVTNGTVLHNGKGCKACLGKGCVVSFLVPWWYAACCNCPGFPCSTSTACKPFTRRRRR
ncbi:unnamed protein product [Polarella glacialis]|uniref:Secreted protein n=1 Tax=Polarella glacialis TaxID=89957 RepID=A0A813LPB2_POLGL|nr:unnamed protein product [Polarella glacialis]